MKNLDKFYTKYETAEKLVKRILDVLPALKDKNWFEPAAGSGNFIAAAEHLQLKVAGAIDILPEHNDIKQADYLTYQIKTDVIFGNPPFGKHGDLALKFLNKALADADYVAFILPNQFCKYSKQKYVNEHAHLIYEERLDDEIFEFNNAPQKINTVFQIWTTKSTPIADLRLRENLRTLPGLKTWIYNNTPATLKFCSQKNYGWDFAVLRAGYYNYEPIYDEKQLILNRQYLFVKVIDKTWWKYLKQLDFNALARIGTTIPCFSTTDFLIALNKIKNNELK